MNKWKLNLQQLRGQSADNPDWFAQKQDNCQYMNNMNNSRSKMSTNLIKRITTKGTMYKQVSYSEFQNWRHDLWYWKWASSSQSVQITPAIITRSSKMQYQSIVLNSEFLYKRSHRHWMQIVSSQILKKKSLSQITNLSKWICLVLCRPNPPPGDYFWMRSLLQTYQSCSRFPAYPRGFLLFKTSDSLHRYDLTM